MSRKLLLWIICCLFLETPLAYADVVWPSLYIVGGTFSPLVILAGLITEIIFVKHFAAISWKKSGIIAFLMNLLTSLIGIIWIPISGLLIEAFMDIFNLYALYGIGTFHWSHWLLSYIVIILSNTLIEGLFIQLTIKQPFRKIFWWLFGANSLSVAYCAIYLMMTPLKPM